MQRVSYLVLVMIVLWSNNFAQSRKSLVSAPDFSSPVDSAGLVFHMPQGYHIVSLKNDTAMHYALALKNDTADFEIRYIYWPLQQEITQYKKCRADTGCKMKDPNSTYKERMMPEIIKLTGGIQPVISTFPKDALRSEVHADEGGFVFFQPAAAYAEGYSVMQTVAFHKDNVADVLVVYLSNNRKLHELLMPAVFTALIYKP
jgi:hypothetical protein